MTLREIYIENFGKIKEKPISFSEGINLIYGENESGKSTLHAFIEGMLFGMERTRGRGAAQDAFSRYEPWEDADRYAGRLKFESGGKQFWLSRNFGRRSRKAELFCENDGEVLSVEDGDLEALLGGMGRRVYENTVSIGQMKTQPGESLAAALENYATNYYASGDSELDFEGAIARLKQRSKAIDKEIQENFRKKQNRRDKLEQEASFIWREMRRMEERQEKLEEEIAYQKAGLKQEEELKNIRVTDELRPEKWRIHPIEVIVSVLLVVLSFLFLPNPFNDFVSVVLGILCGIYAWNRLKIGKKKPEKDESEAPGEKTLERLTWELEQCRAEWKEKEVQYSNLRERLTEMDEMGVELQEQERQKEAVNLAMKELMELSGEMRRQMKQALNAQVSGILRQITGGAYTQLTVDDGWKLGVAWKGRNIPADRLSKGTLQQVYLALRMAAAGILQEEEQPVVLDDAFAYYDDRRLAETLRWFSIHRRQTLVFTCQEREEALLKRMGIEYKKIAL